MVIQNGTFLFEYGGTFAFENGTFALNIWWIETMLKE